MPDIVCIIFYCLFKLIKCYFFPSAPPVSFKEITQEERQKSAMELDPVVLTCELSRPDEPANWFKDGVAVLQSDNITIQSEGTMKRLIIRSAALPDAGTYTCQAGDQTMSFTVNIKGKSRNTGSF